MAKTEIIIKIDPDGTLQCEVKGVKGKACMKYMQMIEEILGKVKEKKVTSEYYQDEVKISEKVKTKKA
ncbi:MAG: hypothetical protein A2Y62_05315 [Candidatus Fischerbacteria bacterium RBG_13_37_8]|uniref:DUF2997 domain-containing protein n=1 Tax=Candidatus Fischerbacteria bacterium RBG_13_37_8 TaxID=1817863 RepID=A0A1F5VXL1_9BACT|nr:MAG: hypothetical protein A2Y62_05315 [Candidatus Fischerbacteria bacterium RBG_13_37_8]